MSSELLIKDHNTTNKKGELQARFVVSSTNFTVKFSKLRYFRDKTFLDKAKGELIPRLHFLIV